MEAGIVVDNYKIEKYERELTAKGFTNFTTLPFKGLDALSGCSVIKVEIIESQVMELKKLCAEMELFFKLGN